MKKEMDDLSELFRSRLNEMEMPVKEEFWQQLNTGIAHTQMRKRLMFRRLTTSAAILLLILASSATIWMLSPKEEISEAFAPFVVSVDQYPANSEMTTPFAPQPVADANNYNSLVNGSPSATFVSYASDSEDDYDYVHISMTFSMTESVIYSRNNYANRFDDYSLWRVALNNDYPAASSSAAPEEIHKTESQKTSGKWSMKAGAGIALPDKKFSGLPCIASVTAERRINKYLGLEGGLQYARIPSISKALHYIGIPLKANGYFLNSKYVNLYASSGGTAEKCIAGAPDNSFRKEPVQLSVNAGVGANINLSDKLALFVEPGVSHYFSTDSKQKSVRTARPTNFNLLCGLRINY